MNVTLTFTVNDRPYYLEQVLDSWNNVRDIEGVEVIFNLEPNTKTQENIDIIRSTKAFVGAEIVVNRVQLGVLNNPFMALSRAFQQGADYAILAEDDLLVSDDILEYHWWAVDNYTDDKELAMVCSFSPYDSARGLEPCVLRHPSFASVWVWGTWQDRWNEYIAPTWDHDYSTSDSYDSGWDWNLNLRVLPGLGKKSLQPMVSRVQNIGLEGTHQLEAAYMQTSPVWKPHQDPCSFLELGKE